MNLKKKSAITIVLAIALFALAIFTAVVGFGPTGTGAAKNVKLGLDLSGGVSVTYQAKDGTPTADEMKDTVYKLQQRVTAYSTEATVYQEGDDRITVEIPGATDADKVLEELGKPGSLTFEHDGETILDGSKIKTASATVQKDSMGNNEHVVSVEFTSEGAKAFGDATTEHVKESIAIVYDGETISDPVVQEPITDGKCVISGNFTQESAETLASNIRIGALSIELEEIRSSVVGAQLGEKALSTSLLTGMIGVALIMLFMIVKFRLPGAVSAFALAAYVAIDLILMNAFDVTLTLAGIAGVVLSIGMAVDANVVIFTRIGEEIGKGAISRNAVEAGFHKALSAIVDGNVTTLIAAAVLWVLASGSVKGFAQTLAIGVCVSMFTALVVSKTVLKALMALGLDKASLFPRIWERKTIGFVGKRGLFVAIAVLAIAVGPASMGFNAAGGNSPLNLSLEFKGGTSTQVTFDKEYGIEEIDSEIKPVIAEAIGDKEIQAQKTADSAQVTFKTKTLTLDEREKMSDALEEKIGVAEDADGVREVSFESVSGAVSKEMRADAVKAVIAAIVLMLAYIWIRFADSKFALAAVGALCHDVLVTFACYAAVRIAIGGTFIAAMLTIVGYSINATIVIFDRIRENRGVEMKTKAELAACVDLSLTQTLSRSVFTTLTTFVTIAALYVLGVPAVKDFALPLMTGVIAGCFSSACLAGNIYYALRARRLK